MGNVISFHDKKINCMFAGLDKVFNELKKKGRWEEEHSCLLETKDGFFKRVNMPKLPYLDIPLKSETLVSFEGLSDASVIAPIKRIRFYLKGEENNVLVYKEC